MRVLIIANAPADVEQRWEGEKISDRAVEGVVGSVQKALQARGLATQVLFLGKNPASLMTAIHDFRPEIVFNLCETLCGDSKLEAAVPYVLEWLAIPYTGNHPQTLSLLVDKILTKHILNDMGIPTPRFAALRTAEDLKSWNEWPSILKPCAEDASLGIDNGSVVVHRSNAVQRFNELSKKFGVPVIIERFIPGREVNVALLETDKGIRMGINEIDFSGIPPEKPQIITYEAKWVEESADYQNTPVKSPANLEPTLDQQVRLFARRIFQAFNLHGYARVDFRISPYGKPFVLEINPNPDLSEDAGFAKSLVEMGLTYSEAMECLLHSARKIKKSPEKTVDVHVASEGLKPKQPKKKVTVREIKAADRSEIERMLIQTGFFTLEEVKVALELFDTALKDPSQKDYYFGVAEHEEAVAGYVCYGPTPMTEGTYDIYWICVDPGLKNSGVGKILMAWTEDNMRKKNGRISVLETSGRDLYYPTRAFYLKLGYAEEARIRDFYRPGDDRVIYTKRM